MQTDKTVSELNIQKKILTKAEEKRLFDCYKDFPSIELRNQIVMDNMGLVYKVSQIYRNSGIDIEELQQEGVFGLITAIEKFDPDSDIKFSTYAYQWIRHSMSRYIENNISTIRIPSRMQGDIHKLLNAGFDMNLSHDGEQFLEELSLVTGISVKKILKIMQDWNDKFCPVSINQNIANSSRSTELLEILPEGSADSLDEKVIRSQDMYRLNKEVRAMTSDEEYDILLLRYGLNGNAPHTLKETGNLMGASVSRIHRIEQRVFKRMRTSSLTSYLDYIT